MQFDGTEDIDSPIEAVFAALADPDAFEALARARGIKLTRMGAGGAPGGAGLTWRAALQIRGRPIETDVVLREHRPPEALTFESVAAGVEGQCALRLAALAPGRTRLQVTIDLAPKSVAARMMLQPLRLARGKLVKRFRLGLADYARTIEARTAGET
jgi:uncharacterized protein YndB with AHSA1/START domain